MELTKVVDFQPDSGWIAKRLGIDPVAADIAVQRLLMHGFLKRENGTYVSSLPVRGTPVGTSSDVKEGRTFAGPFGL